MRKYRTVMHTMIATNDRLFEYGRTRYCPPVTRYILFSSDVSFLKSDNEESNTETIEEWDREIEWDWE